MATTFTPKKRAAANAPNSITTGRTRLSPRTERPIVSTTSQMTAATPACIPRMTSATMRLSRNAV